MKVLVALVAGAVLVTACGGGSGPDSPRFGAPKLVDRYEGDVVLAAGGRDRQGVAFVDDRRSLFAVARLPGLGPPAAVAKVPTDAGELRGAAMDEDGRVYVSFSADGGDRVVVTTFEKYTLTSRQTIDTRAGRAVAADRDGLLLGGDGRIVRADGKVVSERWSGPVALAVDTTNRLWAIDAGSGVERARVARGREKNRAKRHRFASFVPEGVVPVAAAADEDNVYVCDSKNKQVVRFHIGLDDVARVRDPVAGMRCEHDIAVTHDGSIVTAVAGEILYYERT